MKHTLLILCLIVFAPPSWSGVTISGGNFSGNKISTGEESSQDNIQSKVKNEIKDDINCKAEIFSHPNVGQKYVERVKNAYKKACAFFGDVTVEAPLEIWISNRRRNDKEGTEKDKVELIDLFCEHRKKVDASFNNCENFIKQTRMGSSNANFWHTKNGSNIKFYHINLRKHSDNLRDPSAEYVAIHEYFHNWQQHKIGAFKVGRNVFDKRVGKTEDGSRPWFTEGGATFLSHYLYSKMAKEDFKFPDPRAKSDHLKEYMLNYLNDSKHKIKEGLKVKELKYADWKSGGEDAYNISTWSAAYLIHLIGLEKYLAIYDDLDEMEFEDAFFKNFKFSSDEFDKRFVDFMIKSSTGDKIKMLPK